MRCVSGIPSRLTRVIAPEEQDRQEGPEAHHHEQSGDDEVGHRRLPAVSQCLIITSLMEFIGSVRSPPTLHFRVAFRFGFLFPNRLTSETFSGRILGSWVQPRYVVNVRGT